MSFGTLLRKNFNVTLLTDLEKKRNHQRGTQKGEDVLARVARLLACGRVSKTKTQSNETDSEMRTKKVCLFSDNFSMILLAVKIAAA